MLPTEQELPDSNTLGGTDSTGAGPDGEQPDTAPETTGVGYGDDVAPLRETAEHLTERNEKQ